MDQDGPSFRYDARLAGEIERRWQERWDREGTFLAPNPSGALSDGFGAEAGRPKFYLLDFFPYPSGIGLRLGHSSSLAREPFPQADPALAAADTVTLPVQVNGKVRFTVEVPAQAGQAEIAELLAAHPGYPRDEVARLVIVPGKIASIVLR